MGFSRLRALQVRPKRLHGLLGVLKLGLFDVQRQLQYCFLMGVAQQRQFLGVLLFERGEETLAELGQPRGQLPCLGQDEREPVVRDRDVEVSQGLRKPHAAAHCPDERHHVDRGLEERQELLDAVEDEGIGCIVFSPLAQGMLTNKYLDGIPEGARAGRYASFSPDLLTEQTLAKIRALNQIAASRGQSLPQMALAWTLRDARVTSTLVGASSVAQLETNVAALDRLDFTDEELAEIDRYATDSNINIWAASSNS